MKECKLEYKMLMKIIDFLQQKLKKSTESKKKVEKEIIFNICYTLQILYKYNKINLQMKNPLVCNRKNN